MTEGDRSDPDADVVDDGDAAIERASVAVAGLGGRIVATLWATVDIERTLAERCVEATATGTDTLLGARVIVVADPAIGLSVAIAEPSTEGRLAATLARHGEGPAGRYVAVADDLDRARARAADARIALSRIGDGPFGPSMLVLLGPATGPHLILCDPAAVPSTS